MSFLSNYIWMIRCIQIQHYSGYQKTWNTQINVSNLEDECCIGRWIVLQHVLATGNELVNWNYIAGVTRNPAGGSLGHPVANDRSVSQEISNVTASPSGEVPSILPSLSEIFLIIIHL